MEITFLGLDEIVRIHKNQIDRYGGIPGIRDIGLLRSAIAMPSTGVVDQYLHTDLFEMAAAYLYHIIQNHPFIDGNKRTGAVAAVVFLAMNGIDFYGDEKSFEKVVRKVSQGEFNKATVADFFRKNSRLPKK